MPLPQRRPRDPWERTPTSELGDPVLPRWFAIVAVVSVPLAIAVGIAALVTGGSGGVAPAARRPPPAEGLTNAVGQFVTGEREPVHVEELCPTLDGVRVAGTDADRTALIFALNELCGITLDADTARRLRLFAAAGGVVRFAQFEVTGVDSTADLDRDPPTIYVNARFTRTDPRWIAPLIVHDTTLMAADPATAEAALAARRAEADVCAELFADTRPGRGCDDATAILALDDPLAALRAEGFR